MGNCTHEWEVNGFIGMHQCSKCGVIEQDYLIAQISGKLNDDDKHLVEELAKEIKYKQVARQKYEKEIMGEIETLRRFVSELRKLIIEYKYELDRKRFWDRLKGYCGIED